MITVLMVTEGPILLMITLYALDIESLEMSKDTLPAQVGFKLWKHTLEKASIVFYYRT